jgi:hypothetical protein
MMRQPIMKKIETLSPGTETEQMKFMKKRRERGREKCYY